MQIFLNSQPHNPLGGATLGWGLPEASQNSLDEP